MEKKYMHLNKVKGICKKLQSFILFDYLYLPILTGHHLLFPAPILYLSSNYYRIYYDHSYPVTFFQIFTHFFHYRKTFERFAFFVFPKQE